MDRGKLTSDPGFGEPSTTAPDRITIVESPRPDESVGDCCPECGGYVFNPETTPPNRFDPFEALDEIEQIVWENAGSKAPEDRLLNGLHALRAYITGMEKSNES